MRQLSIIYQDEFIVAIDKPAGVHVHPPEDKEHRISRGTNALAILRDQLGCYVYPVHRLDRATAGVVVFALNSEIATKLQAALKEDSVKKTYTAVSRGWIPLKPFLEERPLKSIDTGLMQSAATEFYPIAHIELPEPIGPYKTARYTLLHAELKTGRRHQIRRHLAGLGHPLIGDSIYGDGKHNRFFRDVQKIDGLLLHASQLILTHPVTSKKIILRPRWKHRWHQVFQIFGVCPHL